MSEIIDILTLENADVGRFTVDTALDHVPVIIPATPWKATNRRGKNVFASGDSFRLLSCGIVLPESFTFWKDLTNSPFPSISIIPIGNVSGDTYYNPNFPSASQYIPLENYEMVFDTFFDCSKAINVVDPSKSLLSEDFYLSIQASSVYDISMLNVPDDLNGMVFEVRIFTKILHNLILS